MLGILARRFRRRRWRHGQNGLSGGKLVAWIIAMVALHVTAMVWLEEMSVSDALWLTAVTATTVGYGDVAAKTDLGRASTFLFVLVGMVFAAAKLASDWFEWRDTVNLRKRIGSWDWKMHDHLLIIGHPAGDTTRFFSGIARQFRGNPSWQDTPIALQTRAFDSRPDGLPQALCDLGLVHVSGPPTDAEALARSGASHARAVIVLARRDDDALSDAVALDVVMRVREMAAAAGRAAPFIVVECIEERNRARLRAAGCNSVVRPLRAFPEMLARAVLAPGAEALLEDLFTVEGDALHRVDLPQPWRGRWGEMAGRVLESGIGTAIGYAGVDGGVVGNPNGAAPVELTALFVIVHESQADVAARLPALCR